MNYARSALSHLEKGIAYPRTLNNFEYIFFIVKDQKQSEQDCRILEIFLDHSKVQVRFLGTSFNFINEKKAKNLKSAQKWRDASKKRNISPDFMMKRMLMHRIIEFAKFEHWLHLVSFA